MEVPYPVKADEFLLRRRRAEMLAEHLLRGGLARLLLISLETGYGGDLLDEAMVTRKAAFFRKIHNEVVHGRVETTNTSPAHIQPHHQHSAHTYHSPEMGRRGVTP